MPAGSEIVVEGLADLSRTLARTEKNLSKDLRKTFREVAEPVRSDASRFAAREIRNIGSRWAEMRVGVTRNLVYVAPKQRGTRGRTPRSRPNLADLLMDKAMQPALDKHADEIEARVADAFDKIVRW